MIDYIKGTLVELSPTEAVIEQGGIGYSVNITLQTYSALSGVKDTKLYIYEAIREDAHLLYGFENKTDRKLFLLLLSVSGVGANTARIIMSSMTSPEIKSVILAGDVKALKSVKGIGAKTAERIIVDIKDKLDKLEIADIQAVGSISKSSEEMEEAVQALVMLGFGAQQAKKAVEKASEQSPDVPVGQLVKLALKMI
ncbi:MAG: Holliday junction branch migration protein RuvA [Bacteroidales bacterium]|jgi:Holliday junction DNA helicase RuvA|nr:Holliday junction branch migration protein RuvA [Bacteroidales bacterium]MBQ1836249.1 Holliday junction branch migration protein RuvA [Paludibacteraceae bacterium]MBQ6963660.1 Holliday junction branch migration protein RuvA [Paludibacteraceae bacterium]MBQ7748561.1 Holliday junction branch migration protein RuvA [Paludibacteraceae bacterium]